MGLRQTVVVAGWLVLASLTPSVAEACSCYFVQNELLVRPGGELPVDSRGLLWDVWNIPLAEVRYTDLSPAEQIEAQRALLVDWIELWRVVDGQPKSEAFELEYVEGLWLIVPARGLCEGDRYRVRTWTIHEVTTRALDEHRGEFELEGVSEDEFREVDFVVGGPTMAKPGPWVSSVGESRMGLLRVEPGPSCSSEIMAKTLALELAPPPGMSADEFEHYQFETYVDGGRWSPRRSNCQDVRPGRNWTEQAGSDLVYLGCPERTPGYGPGAYEVNDSSFIGSLSPGRHEAYIRAYLPVQGRSYQSNTVAFELDCSAEPTPAPEREPEPESEPARGPTPEPLPAPTARRGCSLARSGPAGPLLVLLPLGLRWARRRRTRDA